MATPTLHRTPISVEDRRHRELIEVLQRIGLGIEALHALVDRHLSASVIARLEREAEAAAVQCWDRDR